jgi:hypothetical protein
MWVEAGHDEKLETLTDKQFRVWFKLLCRAAGESTPGVISGMPEEVLLGACGVKKRNAIQALHVLEALQKLRIVAFNSDPKTGYDITFINFLKRNKKKPSDQPERVKERVTRSRNARKRPSNAPVSPSNALRVEVDKEIITTTPPGVRVTPDPPGVGEVMTEFVKVRGSHLQTSNNDYQAVVAALKVMPPEGIIAYMREVRAKNPGKEINGFAYFLPGINQLAASSEVAAAGGSGPQVNRKAQRSPGPNETQLQEAKRRWMQQGEPIDADPKPRG